MTKSELISSIAGRYPQLLMKDAELTVKTILDTLTTALSEGQRVEIRRFGSFGVTVRPPRVGRNPRSGEKVMVQQKRVPYFKAGKDLRRRVDVIGREAGKFD
jgi:integration host factor subunit beta